MVLEESVRNETSGRKDLDKSKLLSAVHVKSFKQKRKNSNDFAQQDTSKSPQV